MPRKALEAYLIDEATRQVRSRLDAVEAEAVAGGELTDARSAISPAHLKWLVQYQVGKRGWRDIARRIGPGTAETTVQRPVKKAAAMIGLTLRPNDSHERAWKLMRHRDPEARRRKKIVRSRVHRTSRR